MRTKKRPPVAPTTLTKAWSAFFESAAVCDADQLKREGWMTNAEIAELSNLKSGAGRQLADSAVREGKLEKKVAKVMVKGRRWNVNFYRPK
jgi:hypothetical protein